MPNPLLTSTDYPSIRRALSMALDTTTLPDAVIADDNFLGRALDYIAMRTRDADLTNAGNLAHAKTAAINYTAALLAPSAQSQIAAAQAIVIGAPGSRAGDWRPLQAFLFARAEEELDEIASPTNPDAVAGEQMPTFNVVTVEDCERDEFAYFPDRFLHY